MPPVYVEEEEPEPEPVWETPPEVKPVRPPPKPKMTVAQAEAMLKRATAERRAFTLDLCKKKKWKDVKGQYFTVGPVARALKAKLLEKTSAITEEFEKTDFNKVVPNSVSDGIISIEKDGLPRIRSASALYAVQSC